MVKDKHKGLVVSEFAVLAEKDLDDTKAATLEFMLLSV